MDIPRPDLKQTRRRRRAVIGAAVVAGVVLATVALTRLEPAAPTVERATLWIGEVERGEMRREVRGTGTLVPEEVRWIPAQTSGTVERRLLEPGAVVEPTSVILVLSNPQVEQEAFDAASGLEVARAQLDQVRAQLESDAMSLRSEVARIEAEDLQARLDVEATEELAAKGLVSSLELRRTRARADSLATRSQIERERLVVFQRARDAQVAATAAEVAQRRALAELRQRLVAALAVRAGIAGVLQEITVEPGQQVAPGAPLARVAEPTRLMARVRVPATQTRDLTVGLPARVDTRNGVVPGRVTRIDPAVREGTVTVDLSLEGELPRGARPDLNVDATVEIEHLTDVVSVGRPAFGQEGATVGLFRLDPDGGSARRVRVRLGRGSVNTIEVIEGLAPGDQVILSDMSRWDDFDRVKLR